MIKKSINRWAFSPKDSVYECVDKAKQFGFDGIELNLEEMGDFSELTTEKELMKISRYCADKGLRISSLCSILFWKYPINSSNPKVSQKGIEVVKKMLDFAAILQIKVILVVPGIVHVDPPLDFGHPKEKYSVAYEQAVSVTQKLAEYAKKNEVIIGVENVFYNKFLMSPLEFKRFLADIGSPYVKMYFDTGNNEINGFSEDWIEELGADIVGIHLKDFNRKINNIYGLVNLFEGTVNWDAVCLAIKKIGYSGYLVGESLSPYLFFHDELVVKTSRCIDKLIEKINA